ncbi:MAG: Spore coat protein [Bacteroidota bacterium]
MKVTIISYSDSKGGAGIAASRQFHALKKNGIDAKLLVIDNFYTYSIPIAKNFFDKIRSKLFFIMERLFFLPNEKSKEVRFKFNNSYFGFDLHNHPAVLEADIIHLHWINFGTISYKSLEKLLNSKKSIFHTLHDSWIFTGGCHLPGECTNFINECGNCQFLKQPNEKDISNFNWKNKKKIILNSKIKFIACSNWIKNKALKSSILVNKEIFTLGNPINTELYKNSNQTKPINRLLFISSNILDEKKGFNYLVEALNHLEDKKFELVLIGKNSTKTSFSNENIKLLTHEFIPSEDLIEFYASSSVLIFPSLEDNLPNTIMESMACGTPVVAFKTGGIPEMIDHKINGYLANYKDSNDLAKGIQYLLENDLSYQARKKIEENFSEKVIAEKLIKLYQSTLNE